MSALLLKHPTKQHHVSDDLESFMHLINWLVLKWHHHDLTGKHEDLRVHVATTYDHYRSTSTGYDVGGRRKHENIQAASVPFGPIKNQCLQKLTTKLVSIFQQHYMAIQPEIERLDRITDTMTPRPPPQKKQDNEPQAKSHEYHDDDLSDDDLSDDDSSDDDDPVNPESPSIAPPTTTVTLRKVSHKRLIVAIRRRWRKCKDVSDEEEKLPDQFAFFSPPEKVPMIAENSTGGKRKLGNSMPMAQGKPKKVKRSTQTPNVTLESVPEAEVYALEEANM